MKNPYLNRREFIKGGLVGVSTAIVLSHPLKTFASPEKSSGTASKVIVAKGASPADNVRKAVVALGGMEKFVKKGDRVLLKPNSISSAGPTAAINTHPEVIREVARLCLKAGASEVVAGMRDAIYYSKANGTLSALEAVGAKINCADKRDRFKKVNLYRGIVNRQTEALMELLDFEVFINLPIAKHHAGAQLTLGMKNYMGLIWEAQYMHKIGLDQAIADLVTVRPPDLTIIDATRILLNNGPSGPGTVREEKTIIASSDILSADAYATTIFGLEPRKIRHLQCGYDCGIGEIDLKKMEIVRI